MSTSVVQDSTKAVYGMWTSYSNCPNSLNFAKLELYGHKVYFLGIQYSSNFWYPVVQLCFFISEIYRMLVNICAFVSALSAAILMSS